MTFDCQCSSKREMKHECWEIHRLHISHGNSTLAENRWRFTKIKIFTSKFKKLKLKNIFTNYKANADHFASRATALEGTMTGKRPHIQQAGNFPDKQISRMVSYPCFGRSLIHVEVSDDED